MARTPATRQAWLKATRRLGQVGRGASALRRKREALVRELFRAAQPAVDLRERIDEALERAWPLVLDATTVAGGAGVRAAGWPPHTVAVEVSARTVWGIPIAEVVDPPALRRTLAARALSPTLDAAAARAGEAVEGFTELLLPAAGRESLLRRLGEALRRTSRQIQTLERRLAPALQADARRIRGVLEEREREEHDRVRRLRGAPGR